MEQRKEKKKNMNGGGKEKEEWFKKDCNKDQKLTFFIIYFLDINNINGKNGRGVLGQEKITFTPFLY